MQSYRKNNSINQPDPLELSETKPPTKKYMWRDPGLQLQMWQRMALSGINGRGGPWSCEGSMPQCRGMLGRVRRKCMGGWGSTLIKAGGGGWVREFVEGKPRKGITFEM